MVNLKHQQIIETRPDGSVRTKDTKRGEARLFDTMAEAEDFENELESMKE